MAASDFFRLSSVFGWFRRRLSFFWRYTKLTACALYRYAIGWKPSPEDKVCHGEPALPSEDEAPQGSPSGEVPGYRPEGQHEAAARERPAELTHERPRFEDDEEYRVDPTDELYCGYDSTWETEEPVGPSGRTTRPAVHNFMFNRFESAAKDMQNYRHGYPFRMEQSWRRDKPNLEFYLGMTRSVPDGVSIDGFHQDWYGDYDRLESVHSYIQLFPLQEPGMNRDASTMTTEEIEEFLQSNITKGNLLKSYKLMLDFYGIELSDEKTGEVRRACNWRDRFNNLNRQTHNNLRITRILKCLGTLGYRHYQAPLVYFFLKETLVHKELPQVRDSVLHYFVFAVLDKGERRSLIKFAYLSYDRKEEFVWCPKKIQIKWSQGMSGRRDLLHCGDESQEEEV
ncbi:opioid growth factor receptor-like isoform 2-T2 [Spinachia spinachia]